MKASTVFNGYICANLCYHLGNSGVFDLFSNDTEIDSNIYLSYGDKNKSNLVRSLLEYSLKFGVLKRNGFDKISLSELGRDLKKNIGFFTWAVGGYGDFIKNFPGVMESEDPFFYSMINGGDIALGSRQANKAFMWNTVLAQFNKQSIHNIVDLGSGNGGALINICSEFPNATAIGIDISSKAVSSAKENIATHGLQDRITIHNQNVLNAIEDVALIKKFEGVDTVMSFMMMHDLFNAQNPVDVLKKLRSTFPNASTFFIADTFLSDETLLNADTPIFSSGFEYVHHFMNIKLFKKEEYESFFEQAGFMVVEQEYLHVPNTYLFVLK